jgi:hypothetical protein
MSRKGMYSPNTFSWHPGLMIVVVHFQCPVYNRNRVFNILNLFKYINYFLCEIIGPLTETDNVKINEDTAVAVTIMA